MEVYTTEPAMQIYTANSHNGSIIGKQGKPYIKQNAICFETMHFPDSPNNPQWPSTQLNPGETFHSTTIFKFSAF
jgi:aldose 1-epimerase